jgi:DNA mismatch repair protein MutS2
VDHAVLDKLEFPSIRELLAGYCGGRLGRELADRIEPTGSEKTVHRWLTQVRELLAVREDFGLPPLGGVHDVREAVRQSGSPAGLEADVLNDVASSLEATGHIRDWGSRLPETAELLRGLVGRVGDFGVIAGRIRQSIDERGCVRDDASGKLKSIRATIDQAKSQIDIVFRRLLRHSSVTRYLQYTNATVHGDRRVLPLKAEHRGRIDGIIHRSSDSGATLFVEPTEAVELNNSIVRLGLEEHKEITRILGELSRLVHVSEADILRTLGTVGVLDLLSAKVCYAKDYRAIVPIVSEDCVLELVQARHPVLERVFRDEADAGGERRNVVPIDVRLGDDFDVLMITGPNTGGKTVALKTVGLIVAMFQAGIPVPVETGSCVPVFRKTFVDIGDEQSIEQSLSTFSSHLKNQLDILNRVDDHSLVLIDELGSGTDPDEGAAIGRAIVHELLASTCAAVITTHLSALKAIAFSETRVDNASVEFDVVSLKPAYHLRIGEPGNSNALVIAARLGMPKAMVERAKSYLDDRQRALSKAISGTLKSRRLAEEARRDATTARRDAEQQKEELERQSSALKTARKEHDQWVAWINALREGDSVFVKSFERLGTVRRMQFQKQTAVVSSGAVEFEVRLQELIPPEDAPV